MTEVKYKGPEAFVDHRGAPVRKAFQQRPYRFVSGDWIEVEEEDFAMFEGMAKKNPDLWEVRSPARAVKKIARAVAHAVAGEKED